MDMEKTEAEFEFYGFTLEEMKKEYERVFRLHTKRMVEKFTNDVIEAAKRDLTVETAMKIQSLANNALNLIKPETIKFLSKSNALIDKHLAIPLNLSIDENYLQNTPAMDEYERKCKKDIAELEVVYKQQTIMINHLMAELELYDTDLLAEAEIDNGICDLFENNFNDSNFSAEVVDNVIQKLNDIGIESKTQ